MTSWNPWHGCTKISPGCKNCYVYRLDALHEKGTESSICKKTGNFRLPVTKNRSGEYKVPAGSYIYTCFTSDFFLPDADAWRDEAWRMIKERGDCMFMFYTKRIDRFYQCVPDDWGEGYDNVIIGCTVENQAMADYRLPLFITAPIKHRTVCIEPMLERIDISRYLNGAISSVSVGGESGTYARPCDFDWVLDIRRQCVENGVSFSYHQTGYRLIKDGKLYVIPRKLQHRQAKKAGIDYR
ncbi:MAG: DUF5131 family protein [Clostridia bacterium]|nr:DUF5131 family protein [Clostridia bacterium]